jgi:hypothetical protein
MSRVAAMALHPVFRERMKTVKLSRMNEPVQRHQGLRRLFPNLTENELESLARYFDLALEIAGQDSAGTEPAFDNSVPISTLKERSSSNLKNQS